MEVIGKSTLGAGRGPSISQRAAGRRAVLRAAALAAAMMVTGLPSAARALDVEQVQWGFGGQVVPHAFNLLSVLVANSSDQPFDGELTLQKSVAGRDVDAPLAEALYLAPHARRWVQYCPYTKPNWEEWTLSWGPVSPGDYSLPRPGEGPPGCVLLEDPGAVATGGGAVKRFPENLFPASLTATDGLSGVVLDHVPRWEEVRQKAFLEWVRHGGRVHLVLSGTGEYPVFSGALTPLNTQGVIDRVGNGSVHHHPRKRKDLDKRYVDTVIVPGRDPSVVAAEIAADEAQRALARVTKTPDELQYFSFEWEGDERLLTALKKMSRPDHNWVLIHLMSLGYLALIFPGCFVLGRRFTGDYRIVFGTLIAIVGLFSLAFLYVGRRGYNESAAVHAVAIARAAEGDRYDVTQWSNAFVTSGGDYKFDHEGTGRIYSTCQDNEYVPHKIETGAQAGLLADMPPYSSRSFGHRALVSMPVLSASIAQWETVESVRSEQTTLRDMTVTTLPPQREQVLRRLALVKGPQFPREFREICVIYGRRFYSLSENGDRFELKSEIGTLPTFLKLDQQYPYGPVGSYFDPLEEPGGEPAALFARLYEPLVARSVNVTSYRDARKFALPDDRVRLLVYAPLPAELFVKNEAFAAQRGWVLYSLDLFPPET